MITKKEIKRLKETKTFLLDMDGTIYLGNKPLPGAINFLKKIKNQNINFIFLSNNSSKNRDQYIKKLKKLKFPVSANDIFTSLTASIIYLKNNNIKSVYPLGTPGFEQELKKNGIKITDKNPDAVLLGFDKTITYKKINTAYQLIKTGTKYIATHPDILCPTEDGFIPDTGGFIAMFKKYTGRRPLIIGKPYTTMINSALLYAGSKKNETAIIGDRIYTDMKMGKKAGILSILVLSGETKSIKNIPIKPDIIVKNIGELIKYL